jgi:hypothetical protein
MKMFGVFNQNQGANNSGANNSGASGASGAIGASGASGGKQRSSHPVSSHPVSSQFNLASIMRMQSTGCKSCSRG